MGIKEKIIWGTILSTVLVIGGCSQKSPSNEIDGEQAALADTQLYTCGMHPNVIQEGPGNCPICGMKLTPLGGTAQTSTQSSTAKTESGERKILYYRAPMDPNYITPKPGKSPMGMDLIPVYEGEEAFGATVKINPVVEQNIGVRTAKVERRDISQKIRTIGRIDYNEAKVTHVHTKITGWIENTYVNTTGQSVRKGEVLLDIYSPQLVTAQEEYLDALRNLRRAIDSGSKANLESILASTKRRLEYFDISESQIDELTRTGEVRKTLDIESTYNGIVVEKHALDGMEVKSGMRLYIIADLSEIWVYADIYEYEVPWIKEDQEAIMTLSYEPGKKYYGKVQYIYPYLEEKTRTIKVRLAFDNPNLELKPGMYANVDIMTSNIKDALAVPMEAVLFSGERNLVIMALGEGRFAPRDVTIGLESIDGYYEVRDGVSEGETVVTSAHFLFDSESKLQESIAKMLAVRKGTDKKPGQTGKQETDTPVHEEHKEHDPQMKTEPAEPDMERHDHSDEHELHGEKISSEAFLFGEVVDGMLTYYTCPMESHAFVKMNQPGSCPECGMTLVKKSEPYVADKIYYTCPMPEHSYVVTDEPGNCPVCEMKLVEVK